MTDTYADGTRAIVAVLRPKRAGWDEERIDKRFSRGYPLRCFIHRASRLTVLSAVEVSDPAKGFEYHLSVSRQTARGPARCDSATAKWVLRQFALEGAEEDNHVPHGVVRNFWRPVAHRLVGQPCDCKDVEPEIAEDKGDFVWRPVSQ